MELRPGYKQTEVGIIPDDWETRTIGDSMRLINGRAFKPEDWKERGIPIIRIQNLNDPESTFNYCSTSIEDRHLVEAGDLLFAWSGTTGTSFGARVWGGPTGVLNQHIFKVIPDQKKLTPTYAFLVLCKVQESIEKQAHGFKASFVHVKKSDLVGVQLPLPPTKAEQEAIAEALSDTDALIESLEQLIAKKRHLKQGAMQELLCPKDEWVEKRLGNTATLKARIGWQGLTTAEYLETGDHYLVTGTDFKGGYIDWDHCPCVEESRYKQDKNIQLKPHDVLVTKDGTIGKVALVNHLNKPATLNSGVFVIRPIDDAFHPDFFYYLLCSSVFSEFLAQLTAGSTINHLYQKDFVTFNYRTPPTIEEQTAIATILSDMDAEIAALESKLAKTRQLKLGMMQELLTGRIRLVDPVIAKEKHHSSHATSKPDKPHNWAFNEAVVISVLTEQFGKPDFPLGRKRYTKLAYLMHRKAEQAADGYLKKAAGPYNPKTKYAGPEKIALENGYIRECQNGNFKGFVAAGNIEQAKVYFSKRYDADIAAWLEQFRYKSNDELECLATVDMAMQDLLSQSKAVNVENVHILIASEPEWLPKLERAVFSDDNIERAIQTCRELFI